MPTDFLSILSSNSGVLLRSVQAAVYILIILVLMFAVQKFLHRFTQAMVKKRAISSTFVVLLEYILRWSVYIAAGLIILQQVGVKVSSLWTFITATVTLVAVGFVAVWSVLSNLLCTFMLVISQLFQIGDQIEIIDPSMTTGIKGRVRNINLLFTTLVEVNEDQTKVWRTYIPNNLFFQKIVKCKASQHTFSLDEQLFEKKSLLNSNENSDAKI